ncbi:MAG TPA: tetratricopeptide repeat protein [Pyrinomonadaceae bacterium]
MRNRIGASALAAALVFAPFTTALASPFAPAPTAPRRQQQQDDTPPEAEQKIFNQGRELFTKGRYEQAATVFSDFLKKYPNSFISDLMLLWLGRSYIELGKLTDAEHVGQRLRTIPDTPFADIYESELQNARRVAAANPARTTAAAAAAAAVTPTPAPATIIARANPTPAPARTVATPTPRPAPAEVASSRRNPNTPTLNIRGEGNESRPRTTRERSSRRSTSPAAARATPLATPVPTPARREAPVLVSEARQPVTPARSTAEASSDGGTVSASPAPDTTQSSGGFSLTVKQVPDLQLALRRAALAAQPGQAIQLPLVVTNTGNKEDQFRVETDLPAEFQPSFSGSGADSGGMPIYVTPTLARNASLEVNLNIRVPDNAPDNQQQRFLVRAASQASSTVLKVADASLTVVAAALAATSDVTQGTVMPNETFTQRISVRNQGSASARSARADFVFNPDFELVSATPAPINYDRPSRTAIWSLGDLESRDNREITVTLKAVPDALASTNTTIGRGTMRTQSLFVPSNFDGPTISVGRVARAQVDSVSPGLTATPGDTIFIPFIVRNPSNYPESYNLNITAPGAPVATIYADTNGDGQHQDGEPSVTQTSALDPRGGQYPVLLRVEIPRTTPDRQQFAYNLVTRALNASARTASEASTVLTVATPRVRIRPEYGGSEVKPGDTIFYRLVLVNDGGGLAKNLSVTEVLPDALEFVSSAPALNLQDAPGSARSFVWRVPELAPGDTSVLLVTVRVRPNIPADSVLTSRHTLSYQDTNGNGYRGQ